MYVYSIFTHIIVCIHVIIVCLQNINDTEKH